MLIQQKFESPLTLEAPLRDSTNTPHWLSAHASATSSTPLYNLNRYSGGLALTTTAPDKPVCYTGSFGYEAKFQPLPWKRGDAYTQIFEAAIPEPRTFAIKRSVDLSWLTNTIAAGRDACGIDVLAKLITGFSELLTNQAYEEVDLVLRSVPLVWVSPEAMLALARTSFAARHKLTEWKRFVQSTRRELARRGLDPDKLARGLA
jgi:hypothetical protein